MQCDHCSKPLPAGAPACSRCTLQHYCNRECQKQAWLLHKIECATPLTTAAQEEAALTYVYARAPYYRHLPLLKRGMDLAQATARIAAKYDGEFCLAMSFDKDFLAELMYYGYLPMCDVVAGPSATAPRVYVVYPKLHLVRCLVDFASVPPPHKSAVKRSAKYSLSVNQAFLRVCAGIVKQHGENWFYPRLVMAFQAMNRATQLMDGRVQVLSFELWNADGDLVAGECGYAVGATYTSLSGFTRERDGSGTVQMRAMAERLRASGYVLWDLGMALPYKVAAYGGTAVRRAEFLSRLAILRNARPLPITTDRASAKLTRQSAHTLNDAEAG